MFVITNRRLEPSASGLEQFGDTPNPAGPNELRLVEVEKTNDGWQVEVLPDRLDRERKKAVGLPVSKPAVASEYAARKILKRVQREKRNVLFLVHGYNSDMAAVLDGAEAIRTTYNLEVIPFSWPANGGGIRGLFSYRSDKRDARISVGALDRALEKLHDFIATFNDELLNRVEEEAQERFPNNPEQQQIHIAEHAERGCPFTVNFMAHSMGNYLFKTLLSSSSYQAGQLLLFDNVLLVAADTNNADHSAWVDRIQARNRLYITINEDDFALRASRIKAGQEQQARLGHYPFDLNSQRAQYVDFTDAPKVGRSHSYFAGDPLENPRVKQFFRLALNGGRAEGGLTFDPAQNSYRF